MIRLEVWLPMLGLNLTRHMDYTPLSLSGLQGPGRSHREPLRAAARLQKVLQAPQTEAPILALRDRRAIKYFPCSLGLLNILSQDFTGELPVEIFLQQDIVRYSDAGKARHVKHLGVGCRGYSTDTIANMLLPPLH